MRRPLATIHGGDACPPIASDQSLIDAGWCRRYLADAQRAREATELYQSLGYEVLTRAPKPSHLQPECDGCRQVACRDYVVVYTRRKPHHE